MLLTIIYGLICLVSGDISIDYNILFGTIFLDVIFMTLSAISNRKK